MIFNHNIMQLTTYESWSLVIQSLVAIGTIGAVVFSLCVTLQRNRLKYKINFVYNEDNHSIALYYMNLNTYRSVFLKEALIIIDDQFYYKNRSFYIEGRGSIKDGIYEASYGIKWRIDIYLSDIFDVTNVASKQFETLTKDLTFSSGKLIIFDHLDRTYTCEISNYVLMRIKELHNKNA